MLRFIQQLCSEDVNHLVFVKTMKIQWNTAYFEMDQTHKLKLVCFQVCIEGFHQCFCKAINHWIVQMDAGHTGKQATVAKRKKQIYTLTKSDWEVLEKFCDSLEVI